MTVGCMAEGCSRVARSRGLCGKHLSKLRISIQRGETTYEEAERAGLCRRALTRLEMNQRFGATYRRRRGE